MPLGIGWTQRAGVLTRLGPARDRTKERAMPYREASRYLNSRLSAFSAAILLSLALGCGSGSNSPSPPPSLTSIEISPTSGAIRLGASQQYTATGSYSDGTQQE